jgi:hypothetical protein
MKYFLTLLALVVVSLSLSAQHAAEQSQEHPFFPENREAYTPHWRIAVLIGHTFIPAGQTTERVIVPSWGLDIEYWFNPDWGVGLHNDLEIESFLVESGEGELVEREFPLVFTVDALWRPWQNLIVQFGPGIELEPNANYWLIRTGLEYEFHLTHHWDLAPSLFYDSRQGEYDTWTIALGVGKRF